MLRHYREAVLRNTRALLGALFVGLVFGSGCSREPSSPAQRGRATFVRNCSACHGADGTGRLPPGVQMVAPPRDLTDPEFQAQRTDEELLFVLRNGKGAMPPFGVLLGEDQVRDVIAYVRTLKPPASN